MDVTITLDKDAIDRIICREIFTDYNHLLDKIQRGMDVNGLIDLPDQVMEEDLLTLSALITTYDYYKTPLSPKLPDLL